MASITTWTRLEPRTRRATLDQGLQARIHDPLWLLARQWQVGEFQAEDAGSLVSARLRGDAARLSRYEPGRLASASASVTGKPYDGRTPLEAVVERESLAAAAAHPGRSAEAGLHFLRLLENSGMSKYRAAFRTAYALSAAADVSDSDGARFLRVMSERGVDGSRLYADLAKTLRPASGTSSLPAAPVIAAADVPAVKRAALDWLTWFDRRYSEPPSGGSAWLPERMEYAFAVGARTATGQLVLASPEYSGNRLDWYDFDHYPNASLGAAADAPPTSVVRTVIPGPVAFRGMPDSRWWTFEDAESDLGSLQAGPEDLGRMLLLQYALSFSDDWFTIPVELEVGTLLHTRSLVVTDSFGVRTRIKPFHEVDGAAGGWRMFTQSVTTANGSVVVPQGDRMFIPPVLGASLQGRPVEEVHLLRDEMANLAWAVEHKVENARGRARDRHEQHLATRLDPAAVSAAVPPDAAIAYRLLNPVPEHWIPLVPVLDRDTNAVRLRRGAMLQPGASGGTELRPMGVLLEPGRDLRLFDEEVPRAGAHVTRSFQHARWVDGSPHMWMSRRKRPGRGEGWAGLRFDALQSVGTQVQATVDGTK
jgi:hypothetical protein